MPRHKPKPKVGGARPGAGRKPVGDVARSVARTVKLTPAEAAAHDAARGEVPWVDWIRAAAALASSRTTTTPPRYVADHGWYGPNVNEPPER